VEEQETVEQAGIVQVIARAQGPATGLRIVEGQETVEQVRIAEAIARVLGPATGPRTVEVAAIALEIEVSRQDQTAVPGEMLSAAPAAVLAVHERAVREAHRAWEAPAAVVRVAAVGEGGKSNDSGH